MKFFSFIFCVSMVFNLFAIDKEICRPDGVSLFYEYNERGELTSLKSSDKTVDYAILYSEDGLFMECIDNNTAYSVKRELSTNSLLLKETFPTGHTLSYLYNDDSQIRTANLSNFGSIEYRYEAGNLVGVDRVLSNGNIAYTHQYHWDEYLNGETLIKDLGEITYEVDLNNSTIFQKNPYTRYELKLNSTEEDRFSHLIVDEDYDSLGNPIDAVVNDLNELCSYRDVGCTYDLNGNLIIKKTAGKTYFFKYDALGRLISAKTDSFEAKYTYDIFNRRLFKTVSSKDNTKTYTYLYQNSTEIAVMGSQGKLLALRILGICPMQGLYKSISIEKLGVTYAPIYDFSYHIRKLVNIETKEVIDYSALDCYAQNIRDLSPIVPWIYSTQHYDRETNLIYYGDRYYDPSIRRWITPDPLGPIDSPNLYLFVRNHPLKYMDIRGNFAVTVPILIWGARGASLAVPGLAPIVWGATAGIAAYQAGKHIKNHMEKKKEGKQCDRTPKDHERQNNQFSDACKEIEKKLGRKLSEKDVRRLHDDISKKGYGYHEIVEEGYWKFK
jgi:RHS repeat-associated protein